VILEQIIIDILREEIPKFKRIVKWEGMYETAAKRIVKEVKEEMVKY
jgi:AAA+ ATPase superfamily predicted ATPase